MNNEIKGWYIGTNIASTITYFCTNFKLAEKIEFIKFMGSGSLEDSYLQLNLVIAFKDGTSEWIKSPQNSDGSFPADSLEICLKQADEFLSKYITENKLKQFNP